MNKSSKTIILVRHGESTYNAEGIIQGNLDLSHLSAKGKRQVEYVGNWLAELKIDKFYSSPLFRAKESSQIISKSCGYKSTEIIYDKRLEEINFGSWKGVKRSVIKDTFPQDYLLWRKRPIDLFIDNFYPVQDLYERINHFYHNEILNEKGGTILIVGHRGTISALINILLKLPKSHHHFLQIDRGSITVLQQRNNENNVTSYELSFANELPDIDNNSLVDFETEERTKSSGELFLIRHGQTRSNINKEYQGSKDIPLSSLGKKKHVFLS